LGINREGGRGWAETRGIFTGRGFFAKRGQRRSQLVVCVERAVFRVWFAPGMSSLELGHSQSEDWEAGPIEFAGLFRDRKCRDINRVASMLRAGTTVPTDAGRSLCEDSRSGRQRIAGKAVAAGSGIWLRGATHWCENWFGGRLAAVRLKLFSFFTSTRGSN
jgi:hypothetical protein